VSSANGDRSTGRRKKRRGVETLTPSEAGEMLREARERLGIDLAEVHDRTGISWRNLEALESGEVQRFSEPSAAAIAMRRYADLVSVDPQPLIDSIHNAPNYALSGTPSRGAPTVRANQSAGHLASAHLRRYGDDHSHLRSFTQTAEVPAVGGRPRGPSPAGVIGQTPRYYTARRSPMPWFLRFATWLLIFLILVGAAGIAVDHYQPQWLRDIHILKAATRAGSHGPHTIAPTTSSTPTTSTTAPTDEVTATPTGPGAVEVKVATSDYTIVVTTFGACWIEAQTALSVNPIINRTLQAGQSASIPVTGGQEILVKLGSLAAEIKIQLGGQTLQGWSLKPSTVPYAMTFTSN
jgi:hypothetical protein